MTNKSVLTPFVFKSQVKEFWPVQFLLMCNEQKEKVFLLFCLQIWLYNYKFKDVSLSNIFRSMKYH